MNIPESHGALLIGVLFAIGFSGIVSVQTILYFRLYPLQDTKGLKSLVLFVWILDFCHSGFICAAIWDYFIINFGNAPEIDFIPFTLCLLYHLNFCAVHSFFAHRIYLLSNKNWYITSPVVSSRVLKCEYSSASFFLFLRLFRMKLQSLSIFRERFTWVFSVGLALSSTADIWVTLSLFFLLRSSRSRSLSLDHIIDSLILYTLEIGTLTSLVTVISMIFWVAMHKNLIFLAFHVTIEKLYANSFLAALNTRQGLRYGTRHTSNNVINLEELRHHPSLSFNRRVDGGLSQQVQISIEK
ncbi:hypothetical protein BDQ12DRAFT_635230, partial [Crucibulum laeve]